MVSIYTSRYYRPITPEEQQIYDHLLHWIELESPEQMVERFKALFINGVDYVDAEVAAALRKVVCSPLASEDFRYVLNRCCHILINRWQARLQTQLAIPQLIQLFATPPASASISAAYSPAIRRQHHLIQQFTETEQYQTLFRLARVLTEPDTKQDSPLGTLIPRYPYLYEYCLISEDSTQEQQHTVQQLQFARQRQFEIQLAQYVTYQARRSQQVANSITNARVLSSVGNPTLLDELELKQALRYYTGKVDGSRTHRDQALNLLSHCRLNDPLGYCQLDSFAAFKDDLYLYITAAIDASYGRRKFNNQLHAHLGSILPDSHHQPLNDFLLVRTCDQLLNFLLVDSARQPNHYVFVDLINNLGAIITTGLLLRVVLLCRRVIPGLKRRLSILFSHYEAHQQEAVQWLVHALENVNLALTTNFGMIHLAPLVE